ncbi:protein FAM83E isoform X2 [Antennarius striatus]|uniref:protein FAM83E isoform X2 n=1 Tax=Antennarius striatus TaxID=241820 RepID=UPI0035B464B3
MSNSQVHSLDEDAVFLPVTEASPEFHHCEKERRAVERLLSEGPEAFYSSIDTEFSSCFLSSEEVSQITSWAQNCTPSQLQVRRRAHGDLDTPETEDSSSSYFPSKSDIPTPDLKLGWPANKPRVRKDRSTVYTNPPAEGEPPVREIVRRNLQKASKVIAIVTDRLTDGAVIGDLHNAASRGVPVYIILNQRSVQKSFVLNRLRHPNMVVRVLGGKTFCSRMGRMVIGEMKNKFLLVDLETVILGSYSLTWTDAHLHRQLITVLSGPAVDSFDREFRTLFAESLPVTDTQDLTDTHSYMNNLLTHLSNLNSKHVFLEHEITDPPSPPAGSFLDWEAMGVFQMNWNPDSPLDEQEQAISMDLQPQNNILLDENTHIMDSFTHNGHPFVEEKRHTDLTPDKRVKCIIKKTDTRQLSKGQSTELHEGKGLDDEPSKTTQDEATCPFMKRREHPRGEAEEEEQDISDKMSKMENTPSSRKPLILKVPKSETSSSLSDIMKSCRPQPSSPELLNKRVDMVASELSQSVMDLSSHSPNANDVQVPRFKAFNLSNLTPAVALMKKRNDNLKHQLFSTSKNPFPGEKPQSSKYTLDWEKSVFTRDNNQEREMKK